ncbi:MAG: LysR family transcriptional regulator [Kofleriaceae bacterium]
MRDVHDELIGLDLNLLRVLDVLLAERHVTRAATRLGMTQSAASHALARLRRQFDDPLLVRGERGRLVLTARAETLAPVISRLLGELVAAWRAPGFAPATATRTFHLAASDMAELVLLPALVGRVARLAPGVELFVRPVPEDVAAALASGAVDAVLAPVRARDARALTSDCHYRTLFDETFTCAMRRGHPASRGRLTVARFCQLDHLLVAPRGTAGGFVDDALAALGRRRRVAVTVPHFTVAPAIVAASDLVVTLATRVVAALGPAHGLVTRPPPLAVPGFAMHLIWHARAHADLGQRWLREQLVAVGAGPAGRRGAVSSGDA